MWASKWEKEQRIFEKQSKRGKEAIRKSTRDLWEGGASELTANGHKGISLSSTFCQDLAWCWRALATLQRPPGTAALLGCPTCHSSSALWQLISTVGCLPRQGPCNFVIVAYTREMDPDGLGILQAVGAAEGHPCSHPACRHRVSGTTRHLAQFQSPSNTGRFSMIDRT